MTNWINTLPLFVIFSACLIFVSTSKPKVALISIAIIFAGVFIVSAQFNSTWSALIRMIVGFASLLMIFLSANGRVLSFPQIPRSGWLFRLSGFILFALVAVFVSIKAANFLDFPIDLIITGLLVTVSGILVLGITGYPLKVILGILVLYCGFSAIYCSLETSILVNGLLSAINLALGIIGSYLVIREDQVGD